MKRLILLVLVLVSTNAYAQQATDLMGLGMPAGLANLLADDPGTIAAAGAAITTATNTGDYEVVYVSASDGAKGIILSSNTPYGKCIRVINTVAAILLVYPHSATAQINGAGAGVANSLGASGTASYCRVSDLVWYADGSATGSYTGAVTIGGDLTVAGGQTILTGDPINQIYSNAGANTSQIELCIESTCTGATGSFVAIHGIADATAGEQGRLVLSTGDATDADADIRLVLQDALGALDLVDDAGAVLFQITEAGIWGSAAGVDLGLEYVTGANTACTTTCAVADGGALFGVDLAGGATAPVIVEADAATADACLCLERSS